MLNFQLLNIFHSLNCCPYCVYYTCLQTLVPMHFFPVTRDNCPYNRSSNPCTMYNVLFLFYACVLCFYFECIMNVFVRDDVIDELNIIIFAEILRCCNFKLLLRLSTFVLSFTKVLSFKTRAEQNLSSLSCSVYLSLVKVFF